jgi:putative transposase
VEIKAAHRRTRETFGPERLQHDLSEHEVKSGVCRIRRIRKKPGIRCKQKKRFKATRDSRHALPVAENLLKQQFEATTPNQIWLSDITYIPTEESWPYLRGHKDVFTGEIVGYAMGARIAKNLVGQSVFREVAAKRPLPGLIHHSDGRSQDCSHEYRKLLDHFHMRASMGRKGDCYDSSNRPGIGLSFAGENAANFIPTDPVLPVQARQLADRGHDPLARTRAVRTDSTRVQHS